MQFSKQPTQSGFAIFIETICEGLVPAWYDDRNLPVFYSTELEAQREVADDLMQRIEQFLAGERDFEDAVTIDDLILPVDVWPDGSISIEDGRIFGKRS